MQKQANQLIVAAAAGIVINAPFAVGEYLTRDTFGPRTDFPFFLFFALWIEVSVAAYLFMSVIDAFRQRTWHQNAVLLTIQFLVFVFLAYAWVTLVIDQWPCFFLGGSGC